MKDTSRRIKVKSQIRKNFRDIVFDGDNTGNSLVEASGRVGQSGSSCYASGLTLREFLAASRALEQFLRRIQIHVFFVLDGLVDAVGECFDDGGFTVLGFSVDGFCSFEL